ncbi:MAG: EAL domain-containing protein [Halofilum sp. (in: g-proteobacteria)]|nr:EAL domain-containing protein [Halofilum sp. (in: g-proteobacteria)]
MFGAAWILFSDYVAERLASSDEALRVIQTYKGLAYVALTGALLYAVVLVLTRALARTHDRLRDHSAHLTRINRAHAILRSVTDVLLRDPDDTLLLESAARAVVDQGGFPLVWIALYDHDQRRLTRVATAGAEGLARGSGAPVHLTTADRSIITHALYRGQMQHALGDRDPLVARLAPAGRGLAAVGAFPLRGGGDTRGVLVIHSAEAELFTDEEEVLLLSRVADTLGLGLDFSHNRQTLDRLNYHDPITGVGNRNLVENRLAAALNHAAQRDTAVAMLVLDIDDFRAINDSAGREAGDAVLRLVSRILDGVMRPGDTIARLGNDEFGLVFHELPDANHASRLVGRVADRFPERAEVGGHELDLSVSIGVAVYPDDAQDAAELLSRAELALHSQPPGQRSAITYYAPEFDRRASEQRALESALRKADLDREFRLAWQPVVDPTAGRVCAAEALARWHSPELGEIGPARFIPLAEQSGRIRALGQWVLEHACRQAHAWNQAGHRIDIAVNIALDQLQDADFVDTVQQLLAPYADDEWTLLLELTESQFMADPKPVNDACRRLRALGCRIHLDDFGTGYSALNYLVHLPLDGLKLDRTFVQQIESDRGVHAITEAVVALAEKLGLEVTAEGIETEQQLVIVRQLGACNIQGFLFGRPMGADAVLGLAAQAPERVLAN